VRQVKQRKQELSRRSAKGVRRGGNAEINDGLVRTQCDHFRGFALGLLSGQVG
jgi:hypothetical protein